MRLPTTSRGVLLSLLLACSPSAWPSLDIPSGANEWKREYLKSVRSVWGLDQPAWLAAQIGQESGWKDGLTSSAGARGICQFMPGTAQGLEEKYAGLAAWGRYSVRWCMWGQPLLMRELFNDYRDDRTRCNGIKFAGSAYNGGPMMLGREVALCKVNRDCDYRQWTENVATKNARSRGAFAENRGYVSTITNKEPLYAMSGWGAQYCQ